VRRPDLQHAVADVFIDADDARRTVRVTYARGAVVVETAGLTVRVQARTLTLSPPPPPPR
jgi:hypothetical protein